MTFTGGITGGYGTTAFGEGDNSFAGAPERGTRDYYHRRWQDLLKAGIKDEARWAKIQEIINGETGTYLSTNQELAREQGDLTNTHPGNATARMAAKTMAAGLMATIANPARRYLHFEPMQLAGVKDDSEELDDAKEWLAQAENAYYAVQADTNWYAMLQPLFLETGMYGQSAIGAEEHDDLVVRYTNYSIGQFRIADNEYGMTTTFFYRYHASVEQIINRFVLARPKAEQERSFRALPTTVKNNWQQGKFDERHEVIHGFLPNDDADIAMAQSIVHSRNYDGLFPQPLPTNKERMAVKEIYFLIEHDGSEHPDDVLETNYHPYMPVWVPRWNLLPNNFYATGPGWEALSDVLRLRELLSAEGEALEQMNAPAVEVDSSMRDRFHQIDLSPSAVNISDTMGQGGGIRPIFHYQPNLHHFSERIIRTQQDIREQFFNDLFNRISQMEKVSATAAQITITDRERVLQLAPIAERMTNDFLIPHARWLLEKMIASPKVDLGPPPEALAGMPYRVRFSNIVTIAQKSEAVIGAQEWLQMAQGLAGTPDWDRMSAVVHPQRLGKAIAEAQDLPPETLRTEKELKQWNSERDQQEQVAQMAALGTEASVIEKNTGAAEKDRAAAQKGSYNGPQSI